MRDLFGNVIPGSYDPGTLRTPVNPARLNNGIPLRPTNPSPAAQAMLRQTPVTPKPTLPTMPMPIQRPFRY